MASSAKALELKVELCAGAQCGAHVNTTQYVVCGVQLPHYPFYVETTSVGSWLAESLEKVWTEDKVDTRYIIMN